MPTKPTPLATPFSDNANYPGTTGSPHPWSGSVTKVTMSDGEIAAGYEPNFRPPAQKFDWIMWWITNAVLYLIAMVLDYDVQANGFMTTVYANWQIGHVYVAGNRIIQPLNGGVYECTIGGTSDDGTAGHAGPTTTGGAIVDNTATWKYIGYTGYRHGTQILNISPLTGLPNISDGTDSFWHPDTAGGGFVVSTSAGTWQIPISLPALRRITSITFEIYGDGSVDLTGDIYPRRKGGAVGAGLHAINVVNPAAAWGDVVCDISGSPFTFQDGDALTLKLTASATNLQIGNVRVAYDFLPL